MGILENEELRRKITEENIKTLNEYRHKTNPEKYPLYSEEEIKKEAQKVMDNKEQEGIHIMARAIFDKRTACCKYGNELLAEIKKTNPKYKMDESMSRAYYFCLKEEKTPEDREYNKQFIINCGNPEFCKNYFNNFVKDVFTMDMSILYTGNIKKELADGYANFNKFQVMMVLHSCVENGSCRINPKLQELYNDYKCVFEAAGVSGTIGESYASDLYLSIPLDITQEERSALCQNFAKNLANHSAELGMSKAACINQTAMVPMVTAMEMDLEAHGKVEKLLAGGTLPKNFATEYKFSENGKKLKIEEALLKIADGKNVTIVKKSDEELALQQKYFNSFVIDPTAFVKNTTSALKEIYTEYKNSGHFYSITRKEFKDLRTALKAVVENPKYAEPSKITVKDYEEFKTAVSGVLEAASAYRTKKLDENKIDDIRRHRIGICVKLANDFNLDKLDHDFYEGAANQNAPVVDNVKRQVEIIENNENDVKENMLDKKNDAEVLNENLEKAENTK